MTGDLSINANAQQAVDVYLSLGSNLGDREKNLSVACTELGQILSNFKRSHIYETEPLYYQEQPLFLNLVVFGQTGLSACALLKFAQGLELKLGRDRRKEAWMGPRPLDIDLLLYDELVMESEELTLPHPRMAERRFVLVPLLELNPNLADPLSGRLYMEILKKLPAQGIYTYKTKDYT